MNDGRGVCGKRFCVGDELLWWGYRVMLDQSCAALLPPRGIGRRFGGAAGPRYVISSIVNGGDAQPCGRDSWGRFPPHHHRSAFKGMGLRGIERGEWMERNDKDKKLSESK